MKTGEKIGLGLLVVGILVAVYFAFFHKKKDKDQTTGNNSSGPLPSHCNPNRPGWNKYGYQDPTCGDEPAEIPCDPNRPGWNMEGNPDFNCGFARTGGNSDGSERKGKGQTVWAFNKIDDTGSVKIAYGNTNQPFSHGQKVKLTIRDPQRPNALSYNALVAKVISNQAVALSVSGVSFPTPNPFTGDISSI